MNAPNEEPLDENQFREWLASLSSIEGLEAQARRLAAQSGELVRPSDLVQETLSSAWIHRDQVRATDKSTLRAWLKRILQNTFLLHFRKKRPECAEDIGENAIDSNPTPHTNLEKASNLAQIARAFSRLSKKQQELLLRYHVDNQRREQVAEEMGLSLNQFKYQLELAQAAFVKSFRVGGEND